MCTILKNVLFYRCAQRTPPAPNLNWRHRYTDLTNKILRAQRLRLNYYSSVITSAATFNQAFSFLKSLTINSTNIIRFVYRNNLSLCIFTQQMQYISSKFNHYCCCLFTTKIKEVFVSTSCQSIFSMTFFFGF